MLFKYLNFYNFKNEEGVGIIDIVIAIAIMAIAFFSLSQIAILGVRISPDPATKLEAIYFAEEGMEIARVLRDESLGLYLGGTSLGTDYYPSLSGPRWTLSIQDPGLVNGRFRRTLKFNQVCRDPSSDDIVNCIVPGAVADTNTREVISTVSWDAASSYTVVTYITNFLFN